MIVSSHILTELSDMCDTVGIMELGRLIVSGSVDAILAETRTHMHLVLEVLGPIASAIQALESLPMVSGVKQDNGRLEIGFTGTREDLPALHKKLVESNVPVVAFFPKSENLEDLFLRLSTGATN